MCKFDLVIIVEEQLNNFAGITLQRVAGDQKLLLSSSRQPKVTTLYTKSTYSHVPGRENRLRNTKHSVRCATSSFRTSSEGFRMLIMKANKTTVMENFTRYVGSGTDRA